MVTVIPTAVICLTTCNKHSLYLPSFEEFEAEADKLPLIEVGAICSWPLERHVNWEQNNF
jgi:hypothetical protein